MLFSLRVSSLYGLVFIYFFLISCKATVGGSSHEICYGINCSGYGICFVEGGLPYCACREGYHPEFLACVINDNSFPCNGVGCNGHGDCVVRDGQPECECHDGYVHPAQSKLICFRSFAPDNETDMDIFEFEEKFYEDDVEIDGLEEIEGLDLEPPPQCGNGIVDSDEECDDGRNGNQDDGCTDDCHFSCHYDSDCEDGHDCTFDFCDNRGSHRCINYVSPSTTLCRDSAGPCDRPEFCDGVNVDCPVNRFLDSSTICRMANGCDVAEYCTGTGPMCPDDKASCWSKVAAGGSHTCGITVSGALYCWGWNYYGQLGTGDNTDRLVPERIGVESNWTEVSCGFNFTCALNDSRKLYCWGQNSSGQLGDGGNTDRNVPFQVGTDEDWIWVEGGWNYACAIKETGALYCWGENTYGQLGNGSVNPANIPVRVGVDENWLTAECGSNHSCGIKDTGELNCWGRNSFYQLGTGDDLERHTPELIGSFTDWSIVSAGMDHTCAIRSGGGLYCWGKNSYGQLGDGTTMNATAPLLIDDPVQLWTVVAGGGNHTCGISVGHELYCWGNNDSGQLGNGTRDPSAIPVRIGIHSNWSNVTGGLAHTCGMKMDGSLFCWGKNHTGEIGIGSRSDVLEPSLVVYTQ